MKVKIKYKIRKQIDDVAWIDLMENEVEVENTTKGVQSALLGWNDHQHKEAQKLYAQKFGSPYEETNVRIEVQIWEDGVPILNDGEGLFFHFFGQRLFVTEGIKGVDSVLFSEVNQFIRKIES